MSTTIHDAVIVQISGYVFDEEWTSGLKPDLHGFRAKMPAWLRPCVIGPFQNPMDDTYTAFWMPTSGYGEDEANAWRKAFMDLFSFAYADGSSPYEVIRIQFGPGMRGDDGRPQLTEPFACYCPGDLSDPAVGHQNGCPQHGR
jgi:hypothetical protein